MIRIPFTILMNILRNVLRLPFDLLRLCFPIEKNSYIHFVVHRHLPRWSSPTWWQRWRSEPIDLTVEEWRKALKKIAVNQRVTGIVCELKSLHAGLPVLEELRDELQAFKEKSGKKIVFYPQQLGPSEFYLCSVGDQIIVSPAAHVQLYSPAFYTFFFGDILKKLGVEARMLQIGEHKNAPETFTRAFPSPTNRADLEKMLGTHRKRFFHAIAKGRNREEEEIAAFFDYGVFTLEKALELGLIDAVRFLDRVPAYLQHPEPKAYEYPEYPEFSLGDAIPEVTEAESSDPVKKNTVESQDELSKAETIEAKQDTPADNTKPSEKKNEKSSGDTGKSDDTEADTEDASERFVLVDDFISGLPTWWSWKPIRRPRNIAVIPIEGTIRDGEGSSNSFQEQGAVDSVVIESLDDARNSGRVKAAVLFIDSRGGSGHASEAIWWAARRLAKEKPVVAFLDNYAASGGYYIACGADLIISSPTCLTGSIGVFGGKFLVRKLMDQFQVGLTVVGETASSRLYSPFHAPNQEEEERLKHQFAIFYERFLQRVAANRKVPVSEIEKKAQGKVYYGHEALKMGLVDELGSFKDALEKAKELAGLSRYETVLFKQSSSFSVMDYMSARTQAMAQQAASAHLQMPQVAAGLEAALQPEQLIAWLGMAERKGSLAVAQGLAKELRWLVPMMMQDKPVMWSDLHLQM